MTEFEILNSVMGGITLKDMSAISFFGFVADKLNGVDANTPECAELRMLVSNPPMSRKYPDDEKIKIIAKLKKLGVQF